MIVGILMNFWKDAYISANEQKKKEVIIYVFLGIFSIILLITIFIFLNFYNKQPNKGEVSEVNSISALEGNIESDNSKQTETSLKHETIQSEQETDPIDDMEDHYYKQMKAVWLEAQNYIDSKNDSEARIAVQSPKGVVNGKYSELFGNTLKMNN